MKRTSSSWLNLVLGLLLWLAPRWIKCSVDELSGIEFCDDLLRANYTFKGVNLVGRQAWIAMGEAIYKVPLGYLERSTPGTQVDKDEQTMNATSFYRISTQRWNFRQPHQPPIKRAKWFDWWHFENLDKDTELLQMAAFTPKNNPANVFIHLILQTGGRLIHRVVHIQSGRTVRGPGHLRGAYALVSDARGMLPFMFFPVRHGNQTILSLEMFAENPSLTTDHIPTTLSNFWRTVEKRRHPTVLFYYTTTKLGIDTTLRRLPQYNLVIKSLPVFGFIANLDEHGYPLVHLWNQLEWKVIFFKLAKYGEPYSTPFRVLRFQQYFGCSGTEIESEQATDESEGAVPVSDAIKSSSVKPPLFKQTWFIYLAIGLALILLIIAVELLLQHWRKQKKRSTARTVKHSKSKRSTRPSSKENPKLKSTSHKSAATIKNLKTSHPFDVKSSITMEATRSAISRSTHSGSSIETKPLKVH